MLLVNRLRRVLYSPKGQQVAKRLRRVLKPLFMAAGMQRHAGQLPLDPQLSTLIVVSHEASATGAPILALNLCQRLSRHANVVVLLPRGGMLLPDFQATAVAVLQARMQVVFSALLRRELRRLLGPTLPRYALVNSVVSAGFIQPLRAMGVPPIALIHEFSAYIRPLDMLNSVGLWSSAMVFSSDLTRNDVLRRCPQLARTAMPVLAQGPCNRPGPTNPQGLKPSAKAPDQASTFLAGLDPEAILIIGAGVVQPRKGVDLFISVADQIRAHCPGVRLQFAWIGSDYEPLYDFSVSLWLDDQIQRSGLAGRLHMLDHSPAYGALLERANLFLMTSRLDPLPNVAIDALLGGTPVLCFEKACGIANLLLSDPNLGPAWVSPYLNTAAMARQAGALVNDPARCQQLATQGQQQAERWFNMDTYLQELEQLGEQAACDQQELERDLAALLPLQAIDPHFGFSQPNLSRRHGTEQYLLAWRREIWPRKPFPGFHPGIYRERRLAGALQTDPLLHFLQAERPAGPWSVPLITPQQPDPAPSASSSEPVALHIHVHYPELLAGLLDSLAANQVRPDLFLSTSQAPQAALLERQVQERGLVLQDVLITPNRGRDIGPLLTELGQRMDRDYAFHGHLHTKKSALIGNKEACHWRQFLQANLLGDSRTTMADRILHTMQADPALGLVFPDDPTCVGWSGNRNEATALAEQLGLGPLPEAFDFPVGTMFWARRGALTPLYGLELSWRDYPPEPLGYDGTLLHAIERLLPLVAAAQGFRYGLTHVPGVSR